MPKCAIEETREVQRLEARREILTLLQDGPTPRDALVQVRDRAAASDALDQLCDEGLVRPIASEPSPDVTYVLTKTGREVIYND